MAKKIEKVRISKKSLRSIGLAKKFVWLVHMLFNKVLHENERYVLFLLKTEQTFWPTQ